MMEKLSLMFLIFIYVYSLLTYLSKFQYSSNQSFDIKYFVLPHSTNVVSTLSNAEVFIVFEEHVK